MYSVVKIIDKDSYPNWLKTSNSFNVMSKALSNSLSFSYVQNLLKQIDFNFGTDFKKQQNNSANTDIDKSEGLENQLNKLLEHEQPT